MGQNIFLKKTNILFSLIALILTGGYPSNGAVPQSAQSDGDSSNTTVSEASLAQLAIRNSSYFCNPCFTIDICGRD